MIHFNGESTNATGPDTDPNLQQILELHPKFALSLWSKCDRNSGIDSYAGIHHNGTIVETIGLHDINLNKIAVTDTQDCSTLHVYDNTKINQIDISTGEHYIHAGGSVDFLNVKGDAVVHIYGSVQYLNVGGKDVAQVYLYPGSDVYSLHVYAGGFVRAYKKSHIHQLTRTNRPDARFMAEYGAIIDESTEKQHTRFVTASTKTPLLMVRIGFHGEHMRDQITAFCKWVTESVQSDDRVVFGEFWISRLHSCRYYADAFPVTKDIDKVEFCAEVASNKKDLVCPAIRRYIAEHYDVYTTSVYIEWKGEDDCKELKAALVPDPEKAVNDVPWYDPEEDAAEELKKAMDNATPEQWQRLIKDVFGDDKTCSKYIGNGVGEPVEYGKLTGLVKADGSLDMDQVEASLKILADDTTAEGIPHRTHDRGDE